MIPVDADLSRYDLVVAPVLYMVKEGMAEAIEEYVAKGGTFLTGFMSGLVDQSDNVHLGGYPGPLRKLAGIWAEEIDALAPEQSNEIVFEDGTKEKCRMLCDIIHLEGAEEAAHYGSDFYAGTPAVTKNHFGEGYTYYVGTVPSEGGIARILEMACNDAGVRPVIEEETGLEVTRRVTETEEIYFVMNFRDEELVIPGVFAGKTDMLTGRVIEEGEMLKKYEVRVVRCTA